MSSYSELSDEAKEHAFSNFVAQGCWGDWYESTMEYWVEKLEALGISTSLEQMHFSGFGSQGDGACFTGSINLKQFLEAHPDLKKEHAKLYMAVIPFDHRGAACEYYDIELTRVGGIHTHSHHNTVHLGSWDINILPEYDTEEGEDYERLIIDAEPDIEEQCREYMRQLYKDLEAEHDYQQSMEAFLEVAPYQDFNALGDLA